MLEIVIVKKLDIALKINQFPLIWYIASLYLFRFNPEDITKELYIEANTDNINVTL